MMKRLVVLAILCTFAAFGQVVTITDTIRDAGGALASGEARISWPSYIAGNGTPVAQGFKFVSFTNGAFSTTLYPNSDATPAGTSYTIRWRMANTAQSTEYWVVPTGGPHTISVVRVVSVPTPTITINPTQITQGGAITNECMVWTGSEWGPGSCAVGGSGITSLGGQTGATQTFANDTNVTIVSAADTHTLGWTGQLGLVRGGTNADLSATGGANQFLRQSSAGAAVTVSAIADADIPDTITLSNLTQITTRAYSDLQSIPSTFAPSAHAASHQNGGGDEVATATAAANVIPKSGAGGTLADGFIAASNVTQHQAALSIAASQLSDQNAGTDITADLEEETHASEHTAGGTDILTVDGTDAGAATTRTNENPIQISRHDTDCTSLTDGVAGELCHEEDANNLYICEPTAGGCDTPGEWVLTGDGSGAGANSFGTIGTAVADAPTDTITVTDSSTIDFTTTDNPEDITAIVIANSIGTAQVDETQAFVFSGLGATTITGGNLTLDDGVADSPSAIFVPQTGTQFNLFVDDTADDLRITAATASTENAEFENTGTGLMDVLVETSDGVLTSVKDASSLTSGTLADARVAQSNVTQHQAALSIAASQISDQNAGTDITADLEEEGAINATAVTGNAADDQVLLGSGASALAYATIPDCNTNNMLTYTQSTNTWGCDADDGAGGGAPTGAQYVTMALDASLTAERVHAAGTGITQADGGANGNLTVSLDYTDAGADPALGSDEARFTNEGASSGGLVFEGATADTIEGRLIVTDPTTADKTWTLPDASGEISLLGQSIALGSETTGNYVLDVADGTGIDGTAAGVGATYTPVLDTTEVNSITFGDNSQATVVHTVDPTGTTNPAWSYTDGVANLSTGNLQEGGSAVLTVADQNAGTDVTADLEEEGQINATVVTGNAADDQVILGSGASAASYATIPDCHTENMLTYTQATNTWGCESDTGGGGGGDAVEVEDGDNLGTFTAIDTTARFDDGGDLNFVFADGGAGGPDVVTATVRADSVALTTDTTGNYTATIADAGNTTIAVVNGTAEGGAVTLDAIDLNCTDCIGTTEIADSYLLNNGDAITGNLDFNDGTGDTPAATFTPQTGTAFSVFVEDTTDDMRVTANTTATENVEFENTGTGLMDVLVETSDGVLTSVKAGESITSGTVDQARLDANVVMDNEANTYSTGGQNFSAATSLTLPVSAGAAPTANGTIAYDSTANDLEYGDNGTNRVVANLAEAQTFTNKTISGASNTLSNISPSQMTTAARRVDKSVSIFDPTTADTNKIQWDYGAAVTIDEVHCSCLPTSCTVTIQLDERAKATPNTAGTNVMTSSLVCDDNDQSTASFTNAGIAADAPVNLQITAVSGTPTAVRIHVQATRD